jgi:hypothetical protein
VCESDDRLDTVFEAGLDDILIMIQSSLVDRAAHCAKRHDASPRHREAEVRNADGRQTGNVLLVQVVRHVRDLRVSLVRRPANIAYRSNCVERTRASTSFGESTFDLEGAASHSPHKVLRKLVTIEASICRIWTSCV